MSGTVQALVSGTELLHILFLCGSPPEGLPQTSSFFLFGKKMELTYYCNSKCWLAHCSPLGFSPLSYQSFYGQLIQIPHWSGTCKLPPWLKRQKWLFFLHQLKELNISQCLLLNYYSAIIENVMTFSMTIWFPAAFSFPKTRLQCVGRSTEKIAGCQLPTLEDLFTVRAKTRAWKIAADFTHPDSHLFTKLPSPRKWKSITTQTSHHLRSLFPTAIQLLNKLALRNPITQMKFTHPWTISIFAYLTFYLHGKIAPLV